MAFVYFDPAVGGDGSTVSDDSDPATGLRRSGYLTRYVPSLQQTVAVANYTVGRATAAAASASSAGASATSAAGSAASANTSFLSFDKRWLGPKSANPTVDNQGAALVIGATYFNTVANETRVWNGVAWLNPSVVGGTVGSLNVVGDLTYSGVLTGAFRTDAAGNAALGGVPSAWGGGRLGLQVGNVTSVANDPNGAAIFGLNNYFNGIDFIQTVGSVNPSQIVLDTEGVHFKVAASVGAGSQILFNEEMKLDPNGYLVLGGTDTNARFKAVLTGASTSSISTVSDFGAAGVLSLGTISSNDQGVYLGTGDAFGGIACGIGFLREAIGWNTALAFFTNDVTDGITTNRITQRGQINSAGFTKFSNTGSYIGNGSHELRSDLNSATAQFSNTNLGSNVRVFDTILPSLAAGLHQRAETGGTTVYQVLASGTVENATNAYGAISDAKLKNVIGDAPSYWEKYKLIEWIKYTLKNDPTNQEMLGVIAQQVRDVFPGLIQETPDMIDVVKTREVEKTVPVTVTETQNIEKTEIQYIDGKYVQVKTVTPTEVQVPVYDEFLVYDQNDQPVMRLVSPAVEAKPPVLDSDGRVVQPAVDAQDAVYEPLIHKVQRLQTTIEIEEYTKKEPNGEVTLSVKYSILGHISDVVLQEAMQRIEQLESAVF